MLRDVPQPPMLQMLDYSRGLPSNCANPQRQQGSPGIEIALIGSERGAKAGFLEVRRNGKVRAIFAIDARFTAVLAPLAETREHQVARPAEARGWMSLKSIVKWIYEQNHYHLAEATVSRYARHIGEMWELALGDLAAENPLVERRRGHGVRLALDVNFYR